VAKSILSLPWGGLWGSRSQGAGQARERLACLTFETSDFIWALGSVCALNKRSFNAELLAKSFAPPYDSAALKMIGQELGLSLRPQVTRLEALSGLAAPFLVVLLPSSAEAPLGHRLAIVVQCDQERAVVFLRDQRQAHDWPLTQLAAQYAGIAIQVELTPEAVTDPDGVTPGGAVFGFAWFWRELMNYRRTWVEVIAASLILQVMALAMPLFTQAIVDKVVVHRTESTLIAIACAMGVFLVFSAMLRWVRQYLILLVGNKVDAVLGTQVLHHLLRLPAMYFQHRPTGVIAARLQGVETIREFLGSAAVALVLDLPFLILCVVVMFLYSTLLTTYVLAILAVLVILSVALAPVFQARLNTQFLMGARNQAFLTEYIAGLETVKSLQMEPQLDRRYQRLLNQLLDTTLATRQLGNTYQTLADTLEQLITVGVLVLGAWVVMTSATQQADGDQAIFTIGMLVAFQMFAARLSQPVMRLVGLWQQFQQARLAVVRLGDVMQVPMEPHSIVPARRYEGKGKIEIQNLAFRYDAQRPLVLEHMNAVFEPGQLIAIMGPSGCGKSTLAKLMLGFYPPTEGQIRLDGVDIQHLSANELRGAFGVVPQDTVLFSGTVFENIVMANALADFEQVVEVCKLAEIHDTIEALPKGYQTELGERGAGLSGGQRQRLSIARALLKRPKILLFDEPTSALDTATATQLARSIQRIRGKVTIVMVTHAMPAGLVPDRVIQLGGPPALAKAVQ
jgi:ATP-binding cassette, subfamily B, bacterial HlyB/CyaB